MEHARKMILVDPRALQPKPNPTKTILSKLDEEMNEILNNDLPEDEKVKLYNQILRRYLTFQEKEHEPVKMEVRSQTSAAQELPHATPRTTLSTIL